MDVLTSETCRALNNEIIKQVTSSWSLFIQLFFCPFLQADISRHFGKQTYVYSMLTHTINYTRL